MGNQLTKDYLRGFLIPYPLAEDEFWSSQATGFSIQNPIPDTPLPDANTKLYLNSTGECLQDTDIQVITRRSGISSEAYYTQKDNTDSTTIEYGHNPPTSISDFEVVSYQSLVSLYSGNPDILGLSNNSFIVIYEFRDTVAGTKQIKAQITDFQRTVTNVVIASLDASSPFSNDGHPCLCSLEDGSLLCAFLYVENESANINLYRSVDNGETWTFIGKQLLDEAIDVSGSAYTIQKMRIRHVAGQTLIIVGAYYNSSATNKNVCFQYASIDTCNFSLVDSNVTSQPLNNPDLTVHNNQFCIGYGITNKIRYVTLPHAFYSVQSLIGAAKYVDAVTGGANSFAAGTDTNMTTGMIAIHSNSNNQLILAFSRFGTNYNEVQIRLSNDGLNWPSDATDGGLQEGSLFKIDSDSIIEDYRLASFEGGLIMGHSWFANTATNDNSVAVSFLGGYSNIEYQPVFENRTENPSNKTNYRVSYLPIEKISDCDTFTKTGSGTETLFSGFTKLVPSGSSGGDLTYTRTQAGYQDQGLTLRGVIQVVDDNSGSSQLFIESIIKKNPNLYSVTLEFFEDKIEVNGVAITFDCTLKVEFIIEHTENKFNFYYRHHSNSNLRKFTTGYENATATSGTTSSNETEVRIRTQILAADFRIYQFFISDVFARSTKITGKQTIGRRYPIAGKSNYLNEGVSISALGGPSYHGDSFNIQATSLNDVTNLIYGISPSPRVQWRSSAVTSGSISAMRIPFQLSSAAISLGNDLIGFNLHNINFQNFKLQYYNGSSWVDLASFDSAEDMQHGCIIRGKTLVQNTGGGAVIDRNYYFYNELKGYIAKLSSGSGESATTEYIRIASNTEGVFGDSTSKASIIRLEENPATSASTGTLEIMSPFVTGVLNLNSVYAEAFAIYIDSQPTIDNDFRIGAFNLGSMAVTGQQYSKGRRITIEAGSIQTIQQDRSMYSKQVAPDQRTVQISWSDGVDISTLYDTVPDPDFYKSNSGAGSQAISNFKDVPFMLEGILREIEGGVLPLVYYPSLATNTSNRFYNRRHQFMYSILNSEVQIESVTGEELVGNGLGEVMRVSTIDLLEIV